MGSHGVTWEAWSYRGVAWGSHGSRVGASHGRRMVPTRASHGSHMGVAWVSHGLLTWGVAWVFHTGRHLPLD
eukprot:5817945-Prymnesium_polylepis.2